MFFGLIWKTKWIPPVSHWLRLFDFSSETTERNSTKVDRNQDLNILYQVCVFWPISKQKWPPWLILQKGSTLYSGARYVALWAACFCAHKLKAEMYNRYCDPMMPVVVTFHICVFFKASETSERILTTLTGNKHSISFTTLMCVF